MTFACPASALAPKAHHPAVRAKPRKKLHRELRPKYLSSLIPSAAKNAPARSLSPVPVKKMTRMAIHESPNNLMKRLGIETVGGPPDLGTTRPNEWSGLQTTIPAGVPGRVSGITVRRF